MDEPYTKRELDGKFGTFVDKFTHFDKDMRESNTRIETEVSELKRRVGVTNGRVTSLERWQYTFMGGIGVLTFIVVPLLAWALYTLSNIQETVHRSVDEALSAYNITQ